MRHVVAVVLAVAGFACDSQQCVKLSAYPADQAGSCLQPARMVQELTACSPDPQTRGVQIACLVDGAGQLHVTTVSDSAQISGTGWRYTGGVGDQRLSAAETQQCSDFVDRVGYPEPRKECGFNE